jgi:hypothetical protein
MISKGSYYGIVEEGKTVDDGQEARADETQGGVRRTEYGTEARREEGTWSRTEAVQSRQGAALGAAGSWARDNTIQYVTVSTTKSKVQAVGAARRIDRVE